MKNFEKIYYAVKEIEEQTLFNFYRQDENEYVFVYESGAFIQYAHIGSEDVYFTSPNSTNSVLLSKKELKTIFDFMEILKEFA